MNQASRRTLCLAVLLTSVSCANLHETQEEQIEVIRTDTVRPAISNEVVFDSCFTQTSTVVACKLSDIQTCTPRKRQTIRINETTIKEVDKPTQALVLGLGLGTILGGIGAIVSANTDNKPAGDTKDELSSEAQALYIAAAASASIGISTWLINQFRAIDTVKFKKKDYRTVEGSPKLCGTKPAKNTEVTLTLENKSPRKAKTNAFGVVTFPNIRVPWPPAPKEKIWAELKATQSGATYALKIHATSISSISIVHIQPQQSSYISSHVPKYSGSKTR